MVEQQQGAHAQTRSLKAQRQSLPLTLPSSQSSLSAMSLRAFCFLRSAAWYFDLRFLKLLPTSSARLRYSAAVVGAFAIQQE